jgi:hypothetical protein
MVRYLSSHISIASIEDCTISQKIKRASSHTWSVCEEARSNCFNFGIDLFGCEWVITNLIFYH